MKDNDSSDRLIEINSPNGFSLIEIVIVVGLITILSGTGLIIFSSVNRRAIEVAAQKAIEAIKIECEGNFAYSLPLVFKNKNLKNYTIMSDGSNSCYGNPETGLVSAIPEDLETSPSYHYNFNQGKLNCSLNSGELLSLPECLNRVDVRENIGFGLDENDYRDIDDFDPSVKYKCSDVADWGLAQQLLKEGHTYLDRDNDGEACEVLAE